MTAGTRKSSPDGMSGEQWQEILDGNSEKPVVIDRATACPVKRTGWAVYDGVPPHRTDS